MTPFFSIVIPTLNEESNLPQLMAALTKQTFKNFEVIITDGESTDKTKSLANSFRQDLPAYHFLEKKLKNVSMARNFGAGKAQGIYLIFFDADVVISADFLEKIHYYINSKNLDVLTVWNRSKEQSFSGKAILFLLNVSTTLAQRFLPVANGPCMILKKNLFEKIGGFDESIFFGEDFDLMKRANKFGIRFGVFRKPLLYVSTRRFEKEGLFISLYKSIYAIIYQLVVGPIRRPIFTYEMGGQYFKNKSE